MQVQIYTIEVPRALWVYCYTGKWYLRKIKRIYISLQLLMHLTSVTTQNRTNCWCSRKQLIAPGSSQNFDSWFNWREMKSPFRHLARFNIYQCLEAKIHLWPLCNFLLGVVGVFLSRESFFKLGKAGVSGDKLRYLAQNPAQDTFCRRRCW